MTLVFIVFDDYSSTKGGTFDRDKSMHVGLKEVPFDIGKFEKQCNLLKGEYLICKEKTMPITICVQCKMFENKGAIWYDQFCCEPEVRAQEGIDPVTGKKQHIHKNDSGRKYYDDNPYPYARDVNSGNCEYFNKKA